MGNIPNRLLSGQHCSLKVDPNNVYQYMFNIIRVNAEIQDISDCGKIRKPVRKPGGWWDGGHTLPRSESSLLIRLRAMCYV